MEVNSLLNAINSGNALKQAVGIAVLKKQQDVQTAAAVSLIQGMVQAPHPNLGKSLDVKV
ncbi:YjfB family protein [Paenibacillus sp. NPDC056579]|uniref:YjfB family protein n=1 Tax=unclassified Paenibacillus TaxID=185978 RepID=UPI001EF7E0A7|nr:YjfB family protein [Paenibacillus sp. H1-7]ULL19016.1 putative motility protein [Paenibacillus sp. H1-7]